MCDTVPNNNFLITFGMFEVPRDKTVKQTDCDEICNVFVL